MTDFTWNQRTMLLLGEPGIKALQNAHVLIIGLGGVGGYAAEMLCRAGIGKLTLVDGDVVQPSNRNRQIIALKSSELKAKAEVMAMRLKDINPDVELVVISEFIRDERMVQLLASNQFDYVVDAIDTLSPKIYLIYLSLENNFRLISSMGAGGKMDPLKVTVSDISKSYQCALARVVRKRLHKMGIRNGFKVVFSPEEVNDEAIILSDEQNKKSNVGTISYMPAIFGCYCASVVIRDLTEGIRI